jgi:hypothetical protein
MKEQMLRAHDEANVRFGWKPNVWAAGQFVDRKHVLLGPSTVASVGWGDFLHIRCDLPVYSSQKVLAWS